MLSLQIYQCTVIFQCCKNCLHSLKVLYNSYALMSARMSSAVGSLQSCSAKKTFSYSWNCCLRVECFARTSLLLRLFLIAMRILSSVLTSEVSPNSFATFFAQVVFSLNFSAMTSFWDGVVDSFPAKLTICGVIMMSSVYEGTLS